MALSGLRVHPEARRNGGAEADPLSRRPLPGDHRDRGPGDEGAVPALLFESPKGSQVPLLINAFGSERRMAAALGVERLDDIARGLEG